MKQILSSTVSFPFEHFHTFEKMINKLTVQNVGSKTELRLAKPIAVDV